MEYTVEKILAQKRFKQRNGRAMNKYLVKWDGYDKPTWEPARNLSNCRAKIDEFLATRGESEPSNGAVVGQGNDGEDLATDDQVVDDVDHGDTGVDASRIVPSSYMAMLHATTTPTTTHDVEQEEKIDDTEQEADIPVSNDTDDGSYGHMDVYDFNDSDDQVSDQEPEAVQEIEAVQAPPVRSRRPPRAPAPSYRGFLDSDASSDDDDGGSDGEDTIQVQVGDEDECELDDEANALMDNAVAGPHEELKAARLRDMSTQGFVSAYYGEDRSKCVEADNMYSDPPRLTASGKVVAKTMQPIDIFFFFMPKSLWRDVAFESNRYEKQTREVRLRLTRLRLRQKYSSQVAAQKIAEAEANTAAFEPIEPHEILIMLGLLIARSLCPVKMGMDYHWASSHKGAVPAGTWSRFMPRQRFRDINRFLHFSDNNHPMAKKDRAWKIRPVVDTLQRTFRSGFELGRWVAFDEMVIPSRSSRNTVRIYLKNKPHKYGTKLFAVCCGETNYCIRMEVYCGARQDTQYVDTSSGPAAVIRNLKEIWPQNTIDRTQMRVIITDREYTSVSLVLRLLHMGYYNVGTVTTSRLGFPDALKYPFKTIPKRLANQRGLCRLMRCIEFPKLFACSWLDNKPVYLLTSGVSTRKSSVIRKEKNGASSTVSCPEFVASYNAYMGGVDAHDQLRLQRYSVQRSLRVVKYYKTLFFGLFDIALVNSYILHREYCKNTQEKPMSHAEFRVLLHEQLLDMAASDFRPEVVTRIDRTIDLGSPHPRLPSVTPHQMQMTEDKQPSGKYRYRVCKVCSILHEDRTVSISNSRYYCVECSTEKAKVYLCNTIRSTQSGNQLTCFQIWHQVWENGALRSGARKIRLRTFKHQESTDDDSVSERRHSDVSSVSIDSHRSYDFAP